MSRNFRFHLWDRRTTRRLGGWFVALCGAAVAVACCAHAASAAPGGAGTLTDVANAFKATSSGWISTALAYARHLFFALVAIELAWTAITYALQRDNISDFVANVVLKLMGVFFFLALLQNAPVWIPYIVNSFSQAGATIGGEDIVLDPSSTFGLGLQLAKNMLSTLSNPQFFTAIVAVLLAVFCSIGVVIAYAIVAGQLMVTLIESYIVTSGGLFFLGFSGSRWTLPFSEKYVAYAVSVGIKLFMLYLIVGLGETLAAQWTVLFTPGVIAPPDVYIGVAGSALVFMLLGWQIPSLAGSLMSGSPAMTLGTAASTLGTMAAGGAGTAASALAVTGAVGAAGVAAAAALAGKAGDLRKLDQPSGSLPPGAVGVVTGAPPVTSRTREAQSSSGTASTKSSIGSDSSIPSGVRSSAEDIDHESTASARDSAGVTDNTDAPSPSVDQTSHLTAASEGTEVVPESIAPLGSRDSGTSGNQDRLTRGQAMRNVVGALRNLRIPSFPNDAAGGSIHIRFKHHDVD